MILSGIDDVSLSDLVTMAVLHVPDDEVTGDRICITADEWVALRAVSEAATRAAATKGAPGYLKAAVALL